VTVDPEIWKATHFEKQCNHQRILATFPLLNVWYELLLHPAGTSILLLNFWKRSGMPDQLLVSSAFIYSFIDRKETTYMST
jgi:hypothetical protein